MPPAIAVPSDEEFGAQRWSLMGQADRPDLIAPVNGHVGLRAGL